MQIRTGKEIIEKAMKNPDRLGRLLVQKNNINRKRCPVHMQDLIIEEISYRYGHIEEIEVCPDCEAEKE